MWQVLVFKRKLMVLIFILWNVKLLLLLLFNISLRFRFFQKHSFKHTHLLSFLGRANIEGGQTLKPNCILKHSLMCSSGSKKLIYKVFFSNQVTEIMCFWVPSNLAKKYWRISNKILCPFFLVPLALYCVCYFGFGWLVVFFSRFLFILSHLTCNF